MSKVDAAAQAASAPEGLTPMQGELLRRADAILESISSTVSKASDLAMQGGRAVAEQIPDVALQYVAYGRAFSTACVLISVALVTFGFWLAVKYGFRNAQKAPNDDEGDWAGTRILAVIVGGLTTTVGLITFLNSLRDFILVWFAPKVWLLLEIVELVKRVKG